MRYLLLAGLLLSASAAAAQTSRSVQPTELWPEAQGELTLRNGDYLLLSLHGERSTESYTYDRPLGFDMRRVKVSYEHFLNPQWSLGATVRLEGYGYGYGLFAPEVLLRHRAPLFAGITFGQRLGVEYRKAFYRNVVGSNSPAGEVWAGLRFDLEKLIPVDGGDAEKGLALRPRLSYEANSHLRLQKGSNDPDERTIQFTSLRGEVGLRLAPQFDLTPWFAYQTYYTTSLIQYDANGNPVRGGKANYVVPTIGLDLRFTLLPSGDKADRQQLPTQH